jgi:hypothetical protein
MSEQDEEQKPNGHDAKGRWTKGNPHVFKPGNRKAERHGAFTAARRGVMTPEAQQAADDLRAALIAQLGGETQLSTIQRHHVDLMAWLHAQCEILAAFINTHGALDGRHRPRPAVLIFVQLNDRFLRLARTLGVKVEQQAQAPQVPSPAEYLKADDDVA